jgi:hypothetical protein
MKKIILILTTTLVANAFYSQGEIIIFGSEPFKLTIDGKVYADSTTSYTLENLKTGGYKLSLDILSAPGITVFKKANIMNDEHRLSYELKEKKGKFKIKLSSSNYQSTSQGIAQHKQLQDNNQQNMQRLEETNRQNMEVAAKMNKDAMDNLKEQSIIGGKKKEEPKSNTTVIIVDNSGNGGNTISVISNDDLVRIKASIKDKYTDTKMVEQSKLELADLYLTTAQAGELLDLFYMDKYKVDFAIFIYSHLVDKSAFSSLKDKFYLESQYNKVLEAVKN